MRFASNSNLTPQQQDQIYQNFINQPRGGNMIPMPQDMGSGEPFPILVSRPPVMRPMGEAQAPQLNSTNFSSMFQRLFGPQLPQTQQPAQSYSPFSGLGFNRMYGAGMQSPFMFGGTSPYGGYGMSPYGGYGGFSLFQGFSPFLSGGFNMQPQFGGFGMQPQFGGFGMPFRGY